MKTSFYLRMFIVVATVSAIACSESDPTPVPVPYPVSNPGNSENPVTYVNPGPSRNPGMNFGQYQTGQEYHTWVTTWALDKNNIYIGLVAQVPMGHSAISLINNGDRTLVDLFSPGTIPKLDSLQDDYFWATPNNNVLLLYYKGATPESTPPFPLEVVINY